MCHNLPVYKSDTWHTEWCLELQPDTELTSAEQTVLKDYKNRFQSKEFLLNHAEGLPSHITSNAYEAEEANFTKECQIIPRNKVPNNANLIRSHVLYKIKHRDDSTLICKERIAPHSPAR